eukprot:5229627-Prymnesium_polylepis.1
MYKQTKGRKKGTPTQRANGTGGPDTDRHGGRTHTGQQHTAHTATPGTRDTVTDASTRTKEGLSPHKQTNKRTPEIEKGPTQCGDSGSFCRSRLPCAGRDRPGRAA